MRRFRKLPEEVRRRQILDAALHAFSQDGYAKVSMARIAKDAGLTKGGLYFHFASKEEVFSAMVEEELEHRWEIAEQMASKVAELPPLEVVQRVLQRWFALDDRPDLLTPTVIATCIEMERPREAFRRQVERVTGLIAAVLDPVFRVGVIWKETTASRVELERFRTMITGTLGRLLLALAPADGLAR
jgi:AcrR family transcriptional regulator